jgi:Fe-S-cluster containining protein
MIVSSMQGVSTRLQRKDTFRFACHEGLSCFNTCCANKDLVLTPYDVLRIKTRLGIDSDSFLDRFALFRIDPTSGFPVISLRMGAGDPGRRCPFVHPGGCLIYEDRPLACRLFPLGRATARPAEDGSLQDEFFFLLETPNCLGLRQGHETTVEQWIESQGLASYLEMSNRMLGLLFHPARDPSHPLQEAQLKQILVACYNIDAFRAFVLGSRFLLTLDTDKNLRSRIVGDDLELLKLGFLYLETTLFA